MRDVRVLFDDVDHAEDVAIAHDGTLVFGGERGQLYSGDPRTGKVARTASTRGRILGVAVDAAGTVYACDPGRRAIMRCQMSDSRPRVLSRGTETRTLRHPNSIALAADGSAFASDSGAWDGANSVIYHIDASGNTTTASVGFTAFANGIAISPDSKHLYVIESQFGLSRAEILGSQLGEREEVVALPGIVPDGLSFAADGRIIVSCYYPHRLMIVSRGGAVETLIDDPTGTTLTMPTNTAFFGEDLSDLAIANLGGRSIVAISPGFIGTRPHLPANGPERRTHD